MPDTIINFEQPEVTLNIQEAETTINFDQPEVTLNFQEADTILNFEQPEVILNFPAALPGPPGPPGSGSVMTVEAGEDLAAGDMIYIADDGLAYKADASDPVKSCIAAIQIAITTGNTGDAYTAGARITGYTGLTPNTRQFLSYTTPGTFGTDRPTDEGHIDQQVGTAISATDILFNPAITILL